MRHALHASFGRVIQNNLASSSRFDRDDSRLTKESILRRSFDSNCLETLLAFAEKTGCGQDANRRQRPNASHQASKRAKSRAICRSRTRHDPGSNYCRSPGRRGSSLREFFRQQVEIASSPPHKNHTRSTERRRVPAKRREAKKTSSSSASSTWSRERSDQEVWTRASSTEEKAGVVGRPFFFLLTSAKLNRSPELTERGRRRVFLYGEPEILIVEGDHVPDSSFR